MERSDEESCLFEKPSLYVYLSPGFVTLNIEP
jgi:hypothetical protein